MLNFFDQAKINQFPLGQHFTLAPVLISAISRLAGKDPYRNNGSVEQGFGEKPGLRSTSCIERSRQSKAIQSISNIFSR
jgi:hypothetical protein